MGEKITMMDLYTTIILGDRRIPNLKAKIANGQQNFDMGIKVIHSIIDSSARMLRLHPTDVLKLKEMNAYDMLGEATSRDIVNSAQGLMLKLLEQDDRRMSFRKIYFKVPNRNVREGFVQFWLSDTDSTATQDGFFTGQGGIMQLKG